MSMKNNPGAAETLLTAADLAARWQITVKSLANQRAQRRSLPYVKVGPLVRYRLADVLAFESANLVRAA